jgi:hypothetical protein
LEFYGANDLLLIKNTNDSETVFPLQNSTILYSCSSLRITIILFDPNSCLAPFILVSAFHFGDQQGLYLDFKVSKFLFFLSFYLRNRYSSCYFSFMQ